MATGQEAFVAQRRSGPEPKAVTPEAEAFYRTLPPSDYPAKLIAAFPRIANQISIYRGNKVMLGRYLETLLVDQRGGRRGFDFGVLVDIQNLFDRLVGIPDGLANTNAFLQKGRKQ